MVYSEGFVPITAKKKKKKKARIYDKLLGLIINCQDLH